jgi:hypothetical protein
MQPVETTRSEESRHRVGAAFDQNAAKASFSQCGSDCAWGELTAVLPDGHDLDAGQDRRFLARSGNHDAPDAVVPQHSGG